MQIVVVVCICLLVFGVFIMIKAIQSHSIRKKVEEEMQKQLSIEREMIQQQSIERNKQKQEEKTRKEKLISEASRMFLNMDEWNSWETGIHTSEDQSNRIRRAAEESITVCAYDPAYRLAKVKGRSGNYYVCGPFGCSCWDFKKRMQPCKHMYALAFVLNGNTEQAIKDKDHQSLYGLTIEIAGRFKGGRDEIKKSINNLGGIWTDAHKEDASILVCGTAPSAEKLKWFEQYHLPILQDGDIETLFRFNET